MHWWPIYFEIWLIWPLDMELLGQKKWNRINLQTRFKVKISLLWLTRNISHSGQLYAGPSLLDFWNHTINYAIVIALSSKVTWRMRGKKLLKECKAIINELMTFRLQDFAITIHRGLSVVQALSSVLPYRLIKSMSPYFGHQCTTSTEPWRQ